MPMIIMDDLFNDSHPPTPTVDCIERTLATYERGLDYLLNDKERLEIKADRVRLDLLGVNEKIDMFCDVICKLKQDLLEAREAAALEAEQAEMVSETVS